MSKDKEVFFTNIREKKEHWPKFMKILEKQWNVCGAEKYQLTEDKEGTDWICELVPGDTGNDWIIGTIAKYLLRLKNNPREKDLIKISTYCYIMWLRSGFQHSKVTDDDLTGLGKK